MDINEGNKRLIIYFLMIFSLFIIMFIIPNFMTEYMKIINIIIWIITCSIAMTISNEHNRFNAQKEKIRIVVIVLCIYYILYFLSGLFFGFQNSPYSQKVVPLIKNLFFIVFLEAMKEYVRHKLINNTKSFNIIAIITFMFVMLNIEYETIMDHLQTNETIFKYFSSVMFPLCIEQCLLGYLAYTGGYKLVLTYKMPVTLVLILSPIFPNLDWLIIISLKSVLFLLIFSFVNYEHSARERRFTRKELDKNKPSHNIPWIILVLLLVGYVTGLFPTQPFAIMSNSMYPNIKRGDVVVVQKLNKKDILNLKEGDIIAYKLNGSMIVHRIQNIEKDSEGNLTFITKGDNNNTPDVKPVKEDQVYGELCFVVKYIGYPAALFSEKVLMQKDYIET